MKLTIAFVTWGINSWRFRFLSVEQGHAADFEITIHRREVTPEAQAYYDSLKPGDNFELVRVFPSRAKT